MKTARLKAILAILLLLAGALALVPAASAAPDFSAERGYPVDQELAPPPIAKPTNTDLKMPRDYPTQAPTVPHDISAYSIDGNGNKCLSCHKRTRIGDSQAPMVSVTHFINRDNEILADVSPRRYFCTQCHVQRTDAKPLVGNTFVDVERLITNGTPAKK